MTIEQAKEILLDKQKNSTTSSYTYEQLQQAIQIVATNWVKVGQ